MNDPIRELLDREAIRETKARYFRLIDTKQWQALRDVFTDDLRVESSEEWNGPEGFVSHLERILDDARTVHHGHMSEIAMTGPDSARAITAMFDRLEFSEASRGNYHVRGIVGYGHYEEEYRRVDGEWRISFLRLTRLWTDELQGDPPPIHPDPRRH
jgi:hypothetical protein